MRHHPVANAVVKEGMVARGTERSPRASAAGRATDGKPSSRSSRYLGLGTAYVEAARSLLGLPNFEQVRTPFYGLLGHGMELGLKGVIARGAWDDEQLMCLGHDLAWCWRLAQAEGVFEDGAAEAVGAVIVQLSRPHHAQAFRYPQFLSWPLPDPANAVAAADLYLGRAYRSDREPGEAI